MVPLSIIKSLFSNYGESTTIPIVYLIGIFVLSVVWFSIQTNPLDNFLVSNILESTQRSYSDIIPFLPFSLEKPNILDYLLKSVGFLFFGLIFISLRRNLERKFRH